LIVEATRFYDRLAPLFDVMTDWEGRLAVEAPFLLRQLESVDAHTLLDAACGSGGHALALAARGYHVTGADISPAMIELARAKRVKRAKHAGDQDLRFLVAGLGDLASRFSPFDATLCLGNSLPHLLSAAELRRAVEDLAATLRPGGILILHNLNYDRRWQVRPRWFAVNSGVYRGGQVLIWRFADYYDAPQPRIAFHIALFEQGEDGTWSVQVNTTPQRPVFWAELDALLPAAGLTGIRYFGDLTGSPFDPQSSPDLVVVAHKAA
jgi:glycine/sarcosine N-methyltransferase